MVAETVKIGMGHTRQLRFKWGSGMADRLGEPPINGNAPSSENRLFLTVLPGNKLAVKKGPAPGWRHSAAIFRDIDKQEQWQYCASFGKAAVDDTLPVFKTTFPDAEDLDEGLGALVYTIDWATALPPIDKRIRHTRGPYKMKRHRESPELITPPPVILTPSIEPPVTYQGTQVLGCLTEGFRRMEFVLVADNLGVTLEVETDRGSRKITIPEL